MSFFSLLWYRGADFVLEGTTFGEGSWDPAGPGQRAVRGTSGAKASGS